jgi:type IV pilus assembly protein PilA
MEDFMKDRLRNRIGQAHGEGGFTLIELLVVIIILGILLAVAVPSYIGFKAKAEKSAAQANVRAAVPAVEAFYSDNGTYVGLDNPSTAATPGISSYDPASASKITVEGAPNAPTLTSYCISAASGGSTYYKKGPAGRILEVGGTGGALCSTA